MILVTNLRSRLQGQANTYLTPQRAFRWIRLAWDVWPRIVHLRNIIQCCFFTALRCLQLMTSGRVRNKHECQPCRWYSVQITVSMTRRYPSPSKRCCSGGNEFCRFGWSALISVDEVEVGANQPIILCIYLLKLLDDEVDDLASSRPDCRASTTGMP